MTRILHFIRNCIWSGIQVNYEANGWVAHQVSDIWAKTSPDRGEAVWALWPMGGAWLCTHLWEHYTYTMDKVSSSFSINLILDIIDSKLLLWKSCISIGGSNKYRFPRVIKIADKELLYLVELVFHFHLCQSNLLLFSWHYYKLHQKWWKYSPLWSEI